MCALNWSLFSPPPLPPTVTELVCLFLARSFQLAMASSFTGFLDHTQGRTTVGRTPCDEWSARCRDLYLTTHNTHNRQKSMSSVGFEPTISAGKRPQTYSLDSDWGFSSLTEVFLTLTEVFPCFFLSCKANARVKLAKTGHGPHCSKLVVICVLLLLFVLFCVLFVCKFVLYYCHRVTTQLKLTLRLLMSYIYIYIYIYIWSTHSWCF